jgi:hypothetical protein
MWNYRGNGVKTQGNCAAGSYDTASGFEVLSSRGNDTKGYGVRELLKVPRYPESTLPRFAIFTPQPAAEAGQLADSR